MDIQNLKIKQNLDGWYITSTWDIYLFADLTLMNWDIKRKKIGIENTKKLVYYNTRTQAELTLQKFLEKNKMNIKERLEQNKIDTERLLEEKERLERELLLLKEQEKVVFKAGDVIEFHGSKRIVVKVDDKLHCFDGSGYQCGIDDTKDGTFKGYEYKKIGELRNIL